MAFIVGDIISLVCEHTLGSFRFEPKANESFTLDGGGIRNNDDANQITGSGTAIIQKNRTRWSLEGPIAIDFTGGDTIADLNKLTESPEEGVWTITSISGTVWTGKGTPVGDIQTDTNTGMATLKISGGGQLQTILS